MILNPKCISNLPQVLVDYILEIVGYHKCRNGKYIAQLDKTKDIFKQLIKIPLFEGWSVRLYIRSELLAKTYCDKIISLYKISYLDIDTNETSRILTKVYDCSWYAYDESNGRHHVKTHEKITHVEV